MFKKGKGVMVNETMVKKISDINVKFTGVDFSKYESKISDFVNKSDRSHVVL